MQDQSSIDLPFQFQDPFFRLFQKEISIINFEKWLYDTSELENLLGEKYYDLIAVDFKDSKVVDEIKSISNTFLNYSEFETREIIRLLDKVVRLDDDFPVILKIIYDLGIITQVFHVLANKTYGLTFEKGIYYDKEWCSHNDVKRRELVGPFHESISKEAEEIKNRLRLYPMNGKLLKEDRFPIIPK